MQAIKTGMGSANLRVLWSSKGRCQEWMQTVTLSEESWGVFTKGIVACKVLHAPPSTRMATALSQMDAQCVQRLQTFVAHIDCLCGSLVSFSKRQDPELQSEKAIGKSVTQTVVI